MTGKSKASAAEPLRHPEKAGKPDQLSPPRPGWIRVRLPAGGTSAAEHLLATQRAVGDLGLKTVCEEAACPNLANCWSKGHATFLIMGAICTRACAFCNVATGRPRPLDAREPETVAAAALRLGLRHVVITSVDRDDLADGGAAHFARVIVEVRARLPDATIEVLTPDFMKKPGALETVLAGRPDVFNHNLETVPRLYPSIRPGARYAHSLRLLHDAKEQAPQIATKSGLMVGLGETFDEVLAVMDDLRRAAVDILTIGQYLQPTPKHASVVRYWEPGEFETLKAAGLAKGFAIVAASPMTRSSFHAGDDFAALQAAQRLAQGAQSVSKGQS